MGGGNNAYIHRFFTGAADHAYFFLLDRTQQFYLHGQWQVCDLIEKQRAAVGRLEQA